MGTDSIFLLNGPITCSCVMCEMFGHKYLGIFFHVAALVVIRSFHCQLLLHSVLNHDDWFATSRLEETVAPNYDFTVIGPSKTADSIGSSTISII